MVKSMDIREKSLNEIYGWEPVKPELDSYVLRTAARALRLPLKDLSPEEIRHNGSKTNSQTSSMSNSKPIPTTP